MIEKERIQKALARMGVGSRREVERWIDAGFIKQNNKDLVVGAYVSPGDIVFIKDKKTVITQQVQDDTQLLLYNKPVGEICSRDNLQHEKTVFDSLPKPNDGRWVMVDCLDLNSEGLLLFTNNDELAARLMHPSYEFECEYAARVLGEVTEEHIAALKRGMMLEDGKAHFDRIAFKRGSGTNQWYHVMLKEGQNHEVRQLWQSQGLEISRLIRIRFGAVILPKSLKLGQSRLLPESDVRQLLYATGC